MRLRSSSISRTAERFFQRLLSVRRLAHGSYLMIARTDITILARFDRMCNSGKYSILTLYSGKTPI